MGKVKNRRMEKSKPESERDSGFSDAGSEQPESEDASSRAQLTTLVGGALHGLQPMIFMNNVLLKQSGESSAPLKPWAFSPAVEVLQQPQVVFLQPVAPHRGSTVSKGASSKRRRHKKYLPILKSYPRIAPHPGDAPSKSSNSSSSASSFSSASSVKSSSSSHGPRKQKDVQPSPVSVPAPALTDDTPTDPEPAQRPSDGAPQNTDNKVKRFCNTYNILSKSGLLDITLRTKELIRQNRRTQAELDRLREHTGLFTQALETGDSGLWSRLQTSLQEEEERGRERTEDSPAAPSS